MGLPHTMDVDALAIHLERDVEAKRVPCMVVAAAGGSISGLFDDLPRIARLCKDFNAWLHVMGDGIALRTSTPCCFHWCLFGLVAVGCNRFLFSPTH